MAQENFAPLPRITSETVTVGELLHQIQALILEEPRRLNMDSFLTAMNGTALNGNEKPSAMPACGTVACMAGWGAVLLRPDGVSADNLNDRAERAMNHAIGVDGRYNRSVGTLFDPYVCGSFNEDEDDDDQNAIDSPGTRAHAALIAKRIDSYLSQHPEIVDRPIDVAQVQRMLAGERT